MTKESNINSKEGFTIIEVVLVLAIAGLIFLMVFVALPALQRSQRDTQRRNDLSRVDTSLVQYQTNHANVPNNLPNSDTMNTVASKFDAKAQYNELTGFSCAKDAAGEACRFVRDYMNSGSSENDGKLNTFEDPDGVLYNVIITCNWANADCSKDVQNVYSKLAIQSGENYTIQNTGTDKKTAFDDYTIYIVPGGRCVGDAVTASTKRHFAILYRLEGAGVYCIDDQ